MKPRLWMKSAFCVVVFLFISLAVSAQFTHAFDARTFNLGFMMGLNYNTFKTKTSYNVRDNDILLKSVTLVPKVGLNIGGIVNLNIANNFALRFVPAVSLEQRDFTFNFQNVSGGDSITQRRVEAAYVNFPILFQVRSNYWARTRGYVVTGPLIGWNPQNTKKVRDNPTLIKIAPVDISWAVGVGYNLYGDRIKLSPELMYSIGLKNIYEPQYTSHGGIIKQLLRQVITLNINFE